MGRLFGLSGFITIKPNDSSGNVCKRGYHDSRFGVRVDLQSSGGRQRLMFAIATNKKVQRKTIPVTWNHEDEDDKGEAGDDVLVEGVEWVFKKMPESHDDKHTA